MIANLAAAVLLAASLTAAPDDVAESGEPIRDAAYTQDLRATGRHNGRLPSRDLVEIESAPGCLIEQAAAEAWLRLEAAAAADGIVLTPSWCYRSLATQHSTYRRNCLSHEPVADAGHEPSAEPEPNCSVPTARPGFSNHGWGRAVDLTVGDELMACYHIEFVWLEQNAPRFGWVHPAWAACGAPKEEAWHWEWGGLLEPEPEPAEPAERNPSFLRF